MKAVSLKPNGDGTWTARIFQSSYTGSWDECVAWLRLHGEEIP